MEPRKRTFQVVVILSVLYYLLDAFIGTLANDGAGYMEMLITAVPYQELYSRLLAVAFIIIMGIIGNYYICTMKSKDKQQGGEKKLSSDPMLMVNVSNHIRTPLNAIQGFIEMLDDRDINENSRELYINHIRTSSKFLLELINNVTDITLIESNALYLDTSECKLNEMMSQLYSHYRAQIGVKDKKDVRLQLKTNITDKDFTIDADPKRLRQVLENLLENAITFTEQGKIEFGYRAFENDSIEFFVKDQGKGFSEERMKRLLDKEEHVVDKRMAPFDLATLRVKISRKIIELMGGEFTAASQVDEGSDFRFTVPMKIHSLSNQGEVGSSVSEYSAHKASEQSQDLQWSGKTVLIAEDVESNFIYLSEILKETGVNILWAENGKVAVDMALKNSNIDLILMDILMPEMDGYEATIEIKKQLPAVPIIAQTAYHLEEGDYRDAGKYFYKVLIKPIWSHDLMQSLEEIFNK